MAECPVCQAIYGIKEIHTNDGPYYFCTYCEHQWKAEGGICPHCGERMKMDYASDGWSYYCDCERGKVKI